jgi:hypothetical protein
MINSILRYIIENEKFRIIIIVMMSYMYNRNEKVEIG